MILKDTLVVVLISIPLIRTFIHFKKAFDSVNRETMWQILRNCEVPEKIVNTIKCLSDSRTSAVGVDEILSKEFLVSTEFFMEIH